MKFSRNFVTPFDFQSLAKKRYFAELIMDGQTDYSLAGRQLMPNAERARYLKLVLKVSIYALAFKVFIHLAVLWKYDELALNLKGKAFIEMFAGLVGLIPGTVLPILLIVWMARAYHNLHRAGLQGLAFSPGWAIGAWFVPFMNFWRPYKIMKEIWYRTQGAFRPADHKPLQHGTVKFWWILYLAPLPIGFFMALYTFGSPLSHKEMLKMTSAIPIAPAFFQFFSLLMLSSVIRRISLMEERFAERFEQAKSDVIMRTADQYRMEQSMVTPFNISSPLEEYHAPAIQESKILDGEFIETKDFSKVVIGCLCILLLGILPVVALDLVSMSSEVAANRLIRSYDAVFSTLLVVMLFIIPLLIIYFIIWIGRSYSNLRNLRVTTLAVSKDMQGFWWLIPVANIYFAWAMLRDVKKHSQLAGTPLTEEPQPLPLLDWSWFSFILSALFLLLTMQLTGDGFNGRDAALAVVLNVAAYLLLIFGFASAIIVMRKISRIQSELFQRIESAIDKDDTIQYEKTNL